MNRTVVGVDIAKRVFQLHWVELGSGEIVSVQLKRAKFLEHFANRLPCLIGMEACGGAQHWARRIGISNARPVQGCPQLARNRP